MFFRRKSTLEKAWIDFLRIYDYKIEGHSKSLNPGVDKEIINIIANRMDLRFPEELIEFYTLHNGNKDNVICGTGLGLNLNSIGELYKQWELSKSLLESLSAEDITGLDQFQTSKIPNKIKCKYINTNWLPLFSDSSGNCIGVDLDPDYDGKIGQIITFGRDESEKLVLADNLTEFINRMSLVLKSDYCKVEEFEGRKILVLNNCYHAIDYFKEL